MRQHLLEAEAHCNAQDRNIATLQRDVGALKKEIRQVRRVKSKTGKRGRSMYCLEKQRTSFQLWLRSICSKGKIKTHYNHCL